MEDWQKVIIMCNASIIAIKKSVFEVKIRNKYLPTFFLGGIFYIYLFLISVPIFVNISSDGIGFANYFMKTRDGFTINIGILLLPALAILLGLRLINKQKLRVGYFGKLIIVYCYVCFLVMLFGQLKEIKMIRILLLGQVITPFIAYFYLLNFSKHIKFNVVKIILIFSLLLQFCVSFYFNYQLHEKIIFTSSVFFIINNKVVYLYGIYDYYPILFLTLVIFFHETVNKVKYIFQRNALIILTIILYASGLVYHSRNSLIALIVLFVFYLYKRTKEKVFCCFFVWMTVILLTVMILRPGVFYQNSSFTRLMSTIGHIGNYLNNKTQVIDGSTLGRIEAQVSTFGIISKNPLSGIAFEWPFAAHNQYLSILGISGIVTFSLFMLLLWLIYKKLKRDFYLYRKGYRDAPIVGAMYGIFILFIVSSLFQNNFTVTYTSCIFWALMGTYEIYGSGRENLCTEVN